MYYKNLDVFPNVYLYQNRIYDFLVFLNFNARIPIIIPIKKN